jgi:hypothetical protein
MPYIVSALQEWHSADFPVYKRPVEVCVDCRSRTSKAHLVALRCMIGERRADCAPSWDGGLVISLLGLAVFGNTSIEGTNQDVTRNGIARLLALSSWHKLYITDYHSDCRVSPPTT